MTNPSRWRLAMPSTIIAGIAALCLTTSCSLINNSGFFNKTKPADTTVAPTTSAQVSTASPSTSVEAPAATSKPVATTDPKAPETKPTTTPVATQPTPATNTGKTTGNKTTATPAAKPQTAPTTRPVATGEDKNDLSGHLDGLWYIISVNKDIIDEEDDQPYIQFVEKDRKIYASNGCNIINGTYALTDDSNLTFNDVLLSQRMCPGNTYQNIINLALRSDVTVKVAFDHKEGNTYMQLSTLTGSARIELRKCDLYGLSGEWRVAKIDDQDIDEDAGLDIFFNTDDMTVHGNSGCNFFNGVIYDEPAASQSISFSHMAVTMRMCPNADLETLMLVALEQTVAFKQTSKHTLHLLDRQGNTVMVLKR